MPITRKDSTGNSQKHAMLKKNKKSDKRLTVKSSKAGNCKAQDGQCDVELVSTCKEVKMYSNNKLFLLK